MCLGVPGKIVEIYTNRGLRMCKVDFGGAVQEACLETLPEAKPGDYTIVHAGFALSLLSEAEANETLAMLREMAMIDENGLEIDTDAAGEEAGQ
ncbi:MAG: HypC/HybG/HupF family hydrogenase formation chaperone [Chloroflexi bacterium]|nr:HypC/HybG/HupF family hydrogenase formation chaperone [Chloroflexota bacterium]